MGVRGLTTYINHKSARYFENYKLRDTPVIIDGYSLASVLYNDMRGNNSAFGGDYDKYAHFVEKVILLFRECEVVPIVIFDGGYERKKFRTVRKRNESKVISLEKVNPCSQGYKHCFPLMMRQVFRDKLLEMGVALVQSDLEADQEIAALARRLACPVISNDSDFYIFDVSYIPLSRLDLGNCHVDSGARRPYLACKIYRVERFLDSFGGLSKEMLPIAAAILGNDYISRSTFNNLYAHVKMGKGKHNQLLRRIAGILDWLRKETFQSALYKILGWVKKRRRKLLAYQLKKIVKGYTEISTPLESYLPDWAVKHKENKDEGEELRHHMSDLEIDSSTDGDYASSEQETDTEEPDSEEKEPFEEEHEEEEELEEVEVDAESGVESAPGWLLDRSRRGFLHSSVMTLISLRTYFYVPQVECYKENCAALRSLNLLAVAASLTLGDDGPFTVFCRHASSYDSFTTDRYNYDQPWLPPPSLPSPKDIPNLSLPERTKILLNSLTIDPKSNNSPLDTCPSEWKLFFSSMWMIDSDLKPHHLHALFVMLIAVRVLETKIGYYRNKRPFMKRYGSEMKNILKGEVEKEKKMEPYSSIIDALGAVSKKDCLLMLDRFLPYFHVDNNLKNNLRRFRPEVVHTFATLQYIVELANIINSLLLCPLEPCFMGKIYNGTFLYNFTINLKSRNNIEAYMQTFCTGAPTILRLYRSMCFAFDSKRVKTHLVLPKPGIAVAGGKQGKKSRKKKSRGKEKDFNPSVESDPSEGGIDNNENYVDSNNPFSVLSFS